MTTPAVQRLGETHDIKRAPPANALPRRENDRSQTDLGVDLTAVPSHGAGARLANSGTPLDPETRSSMESQFGHDFSRVRIHTGPAADTSARAEHAKAYALGDDVVFREGRYRPGTPPGDRLLVHELAHVVQQSRGSGDLTSPTDAIEGDARQAADAWDDGSAITVSARSGVQIACEDEDVPDEPPTFGNTPREAPSDDPQRYRLVKSGDSWYTVDVFNKRRTAKGTYAFVIQRGIIWVVRPVNNAQENVFRGHTEAAMGGRVEFAGMVTFGGGKTTKGDLQSWNNRSGHYAPVAGQKPVEGPPDPRDVGTFAQVAVDAGLPAERFKRFVPEKKDPDVKPQLPVFQEPKDTVLITAAQRRALQAQTSTTPTEPAAGPATATTAPPKTALPPAPSAPAAPNVTGTVWTVHQKLTADKQSAAVWLDFNRDIIAAIDAEEQQHQAAGRSLPTERAAIRERSRAAADAAEKRYVAAASALRTLADPSTPPEKLTEVIARHNVPVSTTAETSFTTGDKFLREQAASLGRVPSGWSIDKSGRLVRSGTTGTSAVSTDESGQKAVTTEKSSSTSVGLTGGSSSTGSKSTTIRGETTSTTETSTTKSVDWLRADPGYTGTTTTKSTTTDAAGVTSTASTAKTTTVDTSGIGRSTTTSTQRGSTLDSSTSSVSFKRGDGSAVVGVGKEIKRGTVDAENNLTGGTTATGNVSGGLMRDKDKGVGVGADANVGVTETLAKGVTVGPKAGGGGRWFVDVKPVAGKPDRFQLVTTIVLSGSVSLSGGVDDARGLFGRNDMQSSDVKFGVTAGVTASKTAQASYSNTLSAEDAKRYLEVMAANGEGGTYPEHKLLATGFKHGWTTAREMYEAMFTPEKIASQTRLNPDEYRERKTETATGGNVGATVSAGDLGLGASAGATSKDEVTARITGIDKDTVSVALTVNHTDSKSYAGSAKMGVAGGAVGVDSSLSAGATYVFLVPQSHTAIQGEFLAAKTLEDLYRLSGKYSKLISSRSELAGSADAEKVAASVGPLNIKLGGSAAYNEQVNYDASGKQTGATYSGTSTIGGSVGVGDIAPGAKPGIDIGDSATETFTGDVDEHGGGHGEQVAVGKSQHTAKSFSTAKTWSAVKKTVTNDPLKLLTDGAGAVVQTETTEDRTMYFGQQDYDTIVAAAHNETAWMSHVVAPQKRPAWAATMTAIRAASKWVENENGRGRWVYNANKVQQALAKWTKDTSGGQLDAVENVLRPAGKGAGGIQVSLPGPLAALEPEFKSLVVRDPIREAKSLAAAEREHVAQMSTGPNKQRAPGAIEVPPTADPGKVASLYRAGLDELRAIAKRLDTLNSTLADKASVFSAPGIHTEMMDRLGKRITAVQNEIRATEDHIARLDIDVKAVAATAAPAAPGKQADKAATQKIAAIEQERREAEAAAHAKDKQTAEIEARAKFDQMWRESAAINGLFAAARAAHYQSKEDYAAVTRAMNTAEQRLREWKALRERNTELVNTYKLGDWLIGPDTKPAGEEWDKVYKEVHTWK